MEHSSPQRHTLRHERIRGDDVDQSSHRIDAFQSPRIIDELVVREVNGRRDYGEVFAVIMPNANAAEHSPRHPSDQLDSLCLVRYPDTRQVGIASRARVGDEVVMYPGMVLQPDQRVVFGREGDREDAMSEQEVFGRVALTGVEGAMFGEGVSRIHGSIDVTPEGQVTIADGREALDPDTRYVIDIASTNHTRVSVAESHLPPRHDLISEQKARDAQEYSARRFAKIFGAPRSAERGRFGNVQDRLSDVNAETIMDARRLLGYVGDPEVKQIIESHLEDGASASREAAVTLIRTSDTLRFALANYLLEKADKVAATLPERIAANTSFKGANHPGYPEQMRSREYAVVLALSMLDGTFVTRKSLSDKVEYSSGDHGTSINGGQHRLAALALLGIYGEAPGHIDQVRTYR